MTKQEELAGLRELKGHYRSIEQLEQEIRKKRSDFETELEQEVERRKPDFPRRPRIVEQGERDKLNEATFAQYTPPIYFSVILGVLEAIAVIVTCVILSGFYSSTVTPTASEETPIFIFFIIFAGFHAGAVAFLIRFDRQHKVSGVIGFIFCCAISLGPTLGPLGAYAEEIPSNILYAGIGLPAITLVISFVLKFVEHSQFKAQQKEFLRAHKKYDNATEDWYTAIQRIEKQVEKEYQPKRDKMEQLCNNLMKDITTHRTAINAATILHKSFHSDIDYIIRLMETGVADSIKEALQIKRAEDQKSQATASVFGTMLEMENLRRKQEEDRRWEDQRAQWERDRAQADRERERVDQARRAADELERIRKELEDK